MTHHNYHEANPNCNFSLSSYAIIYENNVEIEYHYQDLNYDLSLINFFNGNYINGLSICVNRKVFSRYGFFDERYHFSQDAHRWYEILKFEEPGIIKCAPQSFSRVGLGHIEQNKAALVGVLDMVKFLTQSCKKNRLGGLLPNYLVKNNLGTEDFLTILKLVLVPQNIFFILNLGNLMCEIIAHIAIKQNFSDFLTYLQINHDEFKSSNSMEGISNFAYQHLQTTLLMINGKIMFRGFYGSLYDLVQGELDPKTKEIILEYLEY